MGIFSRNKKAKEAENITHVMKEEEHKVHEDEENLRDKAQKEYNKLRKVEKYFHQFRKDALSGLNFMDVAIKNGAISNKESERFGDKLISAKRFLTHTRTYLSTEKETAQKLINITAHFLEDLHRLQIPIVKQETHELQLIHAEEEKVLLFAADLEHKIDEMETILSKLIATSDDLAKNLANKNLLGSYEQMAKTMFNYIELFRRTLKDLSTIEEDIMGRINAIKGDDKRLHKLIEGHINRFKKLNDHDFKNSWEQDQVDSLTKEERAKFSIKESEVRHGHIQ